MSDERFMKRALTLARRGAGHVEPNPMVGCVLVRDGRIIGEGYHRKFGGPHAEVNALQAASRKSQAVRGATAYVTLEPCSHTGKTGPCAEALIEAGVKRVVVATLDPHPVSTGGIAKLRDAGIDVTVGLLEEQARQLIAPFATRIAHQRPFVIAKWASTIDGATATHVGDSQWISNAQSRRHVHQLRSRVDAIMVGIGTVETDDPQLTARDVKVRRIARRVVVDPNLRISESSKLVRTAADVPVSIATLRTDGAKAERLIRCGIELIGLSDKRRADDTLAMMPLLRELAKRHDATNVLVEGGAGLVGSLHRQGLIDEYQVYIAPRILGDGAGLPGLRLPGEKGRIERMKAATTLKLVKSRRFGDDILTVYRRRGSG